MPEVHAYEQDYHLVTEQGIATIEDAICFAAFRNPKRVLEFADWFDDDKMNVEDVEMECIRQPIVPHNSLTQEEVDEWITFMQTSGFKHAILSVTKDYVDFDIKDVPMRETFIAMTALRSLGEQPDAPAFFYRATKHYGMEKWTAFILSYLMVREDWKSNKFTFGNLNGRSIHIPIDPRAMDSDRAQEMHTYPMPQRKRTQNLKPYIEVQSYSDLHKYTGKGEMYYGDNWWGSGHNITVDFGSNPYNELTFLTGVLYGNKQAKKNLSNRKYYIR